MLSRSDIERLAKLKSEHGILSAYVRMDPRLRYLRQQAATQFKGALKEAERRLQESRWKEALKRESDYVLNFLTSWEPTGQGLAIFSCRPENLLKRKNGRVESGKLEIVDWVYCSSVLFAIFPNSCSHK